MAYRSRPHDEPSKLCGIQRTELGSKEAEMRIIGCDLHARQQTIAMLDTDTGEFVEKDSRARWRGIAEVLFRTHSPCFGGDRSDQLDAVVPGADGRAEIECRVGDPVR